MPWVSLPSGTTILDVRAANIVFVTARAKHHITRVAIASATGAIRGGPKLPRKSPWHRSLLASSRLAFGSGAKARARATDPVVAAAISPFPSTYLIAVLWSALAVERIKLWLSYTSSFVAGTGCAIFTVGG